jgi:hypothetical protein
MSKGPDFESICLPGMTEEFRLNLFIYMDKESEVKIVYICEDGSIPLRRMLLSSCQKIMEELD